MDLGLAGKIAVVTGASKGIGLAVVTGLVAEGARVIAGARSSSPELDALVAAGSVTFMPVDLASPDGPAELVAAAGGLDILVNNVGAVSLRTDGFLSVTDDEWLQTFTLSFMAAMRATRAAIPALIARGGGNVVTIGSVNAFLPDPGVIDYSAAKAAVWNLSKSLSKEFGPQNIRFNTISPGPVATALWLGESGVAATAAKNMGVDFDTARDRVISGQGGFSTGRFTPPSEVKLGDDLQQRVSWNNRFHETLWQASHNATLQEFIGRLIMRLQRHPHTTLEYPGRWERILAEHEDLLNAIRSREANSAAQIAMDHMSTARDVRLRIYSTDPDGLRT